MSTISLDAEAIARLTLHDKESFQSQLGFIKERVNLISYWGVKEGENILEVGCGHGECTVTLAVAVGESGSVAAIDPAPAEYGTDSEVCLRWCATLI